MKLYHFTHANRRKSISETGLSIDYSSTFSGPAKPGIHCMHNISLWHRSGELGNLLYFIDEQNHTIFGGREGFSVVTFNTRPSDKIYVF